MITGFFIIILILSVISLPFSVSLGAQLDVLKNGGSFFVKVFGKKVFSGRIFFRQKKECGCIVFEQKNMQKEIKFTNNKNDENSFSSVLARTFAQSFNITQINVIEQIGKRDDALFTTMALGSARIVTCSILSVVKNIYKSQIYDEYVAKYDNDVFVIAVSGIIKVSIADIIFDALRNFSAKIKRKGGKKFGNRT